LARATFRTDLVIAATAAFLVLFPVACVTSAAAAEDPTDTLSDDDKKCLGCHSTEGLSKSLANGETLSLHVRGAEFAKSVHRAIGCAGCHGDVDLKNHPGATREIKNLRQYSSERTQVCRQCHEEAFKQHEGSVHALRLSQGSSVAPVCTGCHGSHSVSPKTAYETCVNCHAAALGAHQKWLPNAGLHHEVVSCAACHAPKALRMVDLRLYDRGTKGWALEKADSPQFEKLARSIDATGDGLDATELRKLLRAINPNGTAVPRTLRGRIELRTNVEAHRLSAIGQAIRACDNCHRAGAEPFQNVAVSITGADGRPVRYRAQAEVLSAARSVESLPEFYAIGGTRSMLLDALLVLALLAGVGVPAGHITVRWLYRKYLKRNGGHDAPVNPPDQTR
jgi:hypothetical protein